LAAREISGIGRLEETITLSPNHGRCKMDDWGIASGPQLAELTKLLEDYSKEVGIENNAPARDRLAKRIMDLFNEGVMKPEDIKRNLDSSPNHWQVEQVAP
jgi:hypothetical protein